MPFEAPTPVEKKSFPLMKVAILLVLVAGAGGAIWWGLQQAGAIGMPDDPQTVAEAEAFFSSDEFNALSMARRQTYIDRATARLGEDAMVPILIEASQTSDGTVNFEDRDAVVTEVLDVMFAMIGDMAVDYAKAGTDAERQALFESMRPKMMQHAALLMSFQMHQQADPEGMQEVMNSAVEGKLRSFTESGNPQHAALMGEMFSSFQQNGGPMGGGGRMGDGSRVRAGAQQVGE